MGFKYIEEKKEYVSQHSMLIFSKSIIFMAGYWLRTPSSPRFNNCLRIRRDKQLTYRLPQLLAPEMLARDEHAVEQGLTGWTPMSMWRQTQQRLSVTFGSPPTKPGGEQLPRYAVVLFRGTGKRTSSAFAVIIGVREPGAILCCSVVIKPSRDDFPEWDGAHDHDIAKSILRVAQGETNKDAERTRIDGEGWENGARTFWARSRAGKVKVALTPWLTHEEAAIVGTDIITYSVGLELEIGDARLGKSSEEERVKGLSGLSCVVSR